MSNGKRFTLEEAVALTYDDEEILYFPLTAREAFMLLGQVDFIGWQTRWAEQTFSTDYLEAKVASIADGLMNPQELTGMTCADVENCLETSDTIEIINNNSANAYYIQVGQGNQQRADKFTGTNQSIYVTAPNWCCQNNQDSIDRLCYAVDFFVREYVESKKSILNLAIYGAYLNVGLTALLSASLGGLGFIVGGSAITAEVFGIALLQEALDALSDATAVDEVICCILEYLNLKALNETNFIASLANDCHVNGSNADITRQLLHSDRANTAGYLYFVECVGRLQSVSGIVDCTCIAPNTCTGVTQVYEPASPSYFTIPSSKIKTHPSVTITTANFGYNTYLMSQGQWIELEIDNPQCINRMVYTSREGASGTGTVSWNVFVNGVQTGTGIDAHLTSGATENQNKSIFNAGSGSERGSVLRLEYPVSANTRQIQVTNFRVGYLT